MGGKRIRGLKTRVGWECCISRRGPDGAVDLYQLEDSEKEVTVLVGVESQKKQDTAGRAARGVRAAKSSKSTNGEE